MTISMHHSHLKRLLILPQMAVESGDLGQCSLSKFGRLENSSHERRMLPSFWSLVFVIEHMSDGNGH